MRKLIYALAVVVTVALTACSADDLLGGKKGNGTVQYTLQVPQSIDTRSYSDGLSATYISYAVFYAELTNDGTGIDALGELVLNVTHSNQFAERTATVDLALVSGYDYVVVFWADAGPECPYTIDLENHQVTMDYASSSADAPLNANDENRDAFYAVDILSKSDLTSGEGRTVYLRRPFAQLNFGTNDLSTPVIKQNLSMPDVTFTVTAPPGLATGFDLISDRLLGFTTDETYFAANGTPAESDGEFPIDGYSYLSMNYMLAGAKATTEINPDSLISKYGTDGYLGSLLVMYGSDSPVLLTTSHSNINDIETSINNTPLKANYYTNIYGSLLTDPTNYNIDINAVQSSYWNGGIDASDVVTLVYDAESFIQATQTGGRAVLCNDVDLDTINLAFGNLTSLDLAGYTLTGSARDSKVKQQIESLTILNGTLVMTGYKIYLDEGSKLYMDNVEVLSRGPVLQYDNGVEILIENSSLTVTYEVASSFAKETSVAANVITSNDVADTAAVAGSLTIKNSVLTLNTNKAATSDPNYFDYAVIKHQTRSMSVTIDNCQLVSNYTGIKSTSRDTMTITNTSIDAAYAGLYVDMAGNEDSLIYEIDGVWTTVLKEPAGKYNLQNVEISSGYYGVYMKHSKLDARNCVIQDSVKSLVSKDLYGYGIYNYGSIVNTYNNKITVDEQDSSDEYHGIGLYFTKGACFTSTYAGWGVSISEAGGSTVSWDSSSSLDGYSILGYITANYDYISAMKAAAYDDYNGGGKNGSTALPYVSTTTTDTEGNYITVTSSYNITLNDCTIAAGTNVGKEKASTSIRRRRVVK